MNTFRVSIKYEYCFEVQAESATEAENKAEALDYSVYTADGVYVNEEAKKGDGVFMDSHNGYVMPGTTRLPEIIP